MDTKDDCSEAETLPSLPIIGRLPHLLLLQLLLGFDKGDSKTLEI
jgi:hypothetical protein